MPAWIVGGVQFDCKLKDPARNLAVMERHARVLRGHGARFVAFPECALAGYCYDSRAEALPFAETLPGPSSEKLAGLCRELDLYLAYGLLERDGDRLFNSVALVGPQGLVGSYRKTHLPFLGIDRFVDPGDRPYEVFDLEGTKVGLLICFDGSFPEAPRVLALLGADLIVLPTNWPTGAQCSASHIPEMRAHENHVYFLAVNRVGQEGGFQFLGRSRLVDWHGQTLAAAQTTHDEAFFAPIDPLAARQKRVINKPGEYELDRFATRRPDLYGKLLEPPGRKST